MRRLIAAAGGLVIVPVRSPRRRPGRRRRHQRRHAGLPTSSATRAAYRMVSGRCTPRGVWVTRRTPAVTAQTHAGGFIPAPLSDGPNVQMNDDSNPPLPQNETAVAVQAGQPLVAVAAANDYVSGGVVVMRTTDGGRHWPAPGSPRSSAAPVTSATAVTRASRTAAATARSTSRSCASSARCRSPRCRSTSRSTTARPGRPGGRPPGRRPTSTTPPGTVDDSIFNDKELIAVDNTPTSPHYGRVYVTYTKFHLLPSGSSDYCPLQLSYTDTIPTANPSLTTWSHTAIQPDDPGGDGTGCVGQPVQRPGGGERTARSTSASSPRTATTRSTRTCCSRSQPTAG